jgi:hypothetical protein
VLILRRAQKELAGLRKVDYERMRDAIASLADNPKPIGCKKLSRREEQTVPGFRCEVVVGGSGLISNMLLSLKATYNKA